MTDTTEITVRPEAERAPMPRPIAPRKPAPRGRYRDWDMADRWAYARSLAQAGDLVPRGLWAPTERPDGSVGPAAPSTGKIFLVLETGAMLDVEPMAAMQGITVIEGRATISPQLMSGLIRKAGHRLSIRKTGTIAGGDYSATVTLTRSDDPENPIVDTWDIPRAVRAGLCEYRETNGVWKVIAQSQGGKAKPWQAYPESMCVWRATGVVGREGADDVLLGVAYTPEEMEAHVDEEGTILELVPGYEERAIAHLKTLDDKADLSRFVDEVNREDGWTERLRAEFDGHFMTVSKDSRPVREGTPGHTGDPAIDAVAVKPSEPAEDDASEAEEASAPESPAEPSKPAGSATADYSDEEYDAPPADFWDASAEPK